MAATTTTRKPKKRVKKATKKPVSATTRAAHEKMYAKKVRELKPLVQEILRLASRKTTGRPSLNRKIGRYLPNSPPTPSLLDLYYGNGGSYPTHFRTFRRELYDNPDFASGFYHEK
jgi:hypothetical protein